MFHVFERHLVPVADQGGLIVDAVLGPCIGSILCIPCIPCIPCIRCIPCIPCIHCLRRVFEGDPKRPVPPSIFVVGDGSTGQKTNGLTTGNARHPTLFSIVFFGLQFLSTFSILLFQQRQPTIPIQHHFIGFHPLQQRLHGAVLVVVQLHRLRPLSMHTRRIPKRQVAFLVHLP